MRTGCVIVFDESNLVSGANPDDPSYIDFKESMKVVVADIVIYQRTRNSIPKILKNRWGKTRID